MAKAVKVAMPDEVEEIEERWRPDYLFQFERGWEDVNVRYAVIGIIRRGLFTGYVHDYCGGGSWDKIWIFRSQPIYSSYYWDDPKCISKPARRLLDQAYPGLIEEIDRVRQKFFRWNDGSPSATRHALVEQFHQEDGLVTHGDPRPITIANTMYSNSLRLRSRLELLEDGRIVTLAQYKRIMKKQGYEVD